MGCDIHFFCEKLTTDYNYHGPKNTGEIRDEKLENLLQIDKDEKSPRWVTADIWEKVDDDYWKTKELYPGGRNYYLFGVLAGVRYDIDPISEPKGIPDDCCYPIKSKIEGYGSDGHSHSYFTLKELLDVDWTKYQGIVTYKDWNVERTVDRTGWLNDFMTAIDKMKEIDPDPNKVRCVFFFDN